MRNFDFKKIWSVLKPIGKNATVSISVRKVTTYIEAVCEKYQVREDYSKEIIEKTSSLMEYLLKAKLNSDRIDPVYVKEFIRGPIAEALLKGISSANNSENMVAELLSKVEMEHISKIEKALADMGVDGASEYIGILRNVIMQIKNGNVQFATSDFSDVPYADVVDNSQINMQRVAMSDEKEYEHMAKSDMIDTTEDTFVSDLSKRLMSGGGKAPTPLDMFNLVGKFVDASKDVAKYTEMQKTKRVEIRAAAKVQIKKIEMMRDTIQLYLNKTFDERRMIFEKQFACVDKALETGDTQLLTISLNSITDLAKSSPFKNLSDVRNVKNMLEDKNVVFDI